MRRIVYIDYFSGISIYRNGKLRRYGKHRSHEKRLAKICTAGRRMMSFYPGAGTAYDMSNMAPSSKRGEATLPAAEVHKGT